MSVRKMTDTRKEEPIWLKKGKLKILAAPHKVVMLQANGWQVSGENNNYSRECNYEKEH